MTGKYNEIGKAEQREPLPLLIYVSEMLAFTKEIWVKRGG